MLNTWTKIKLKLNVTLLITEYTELESQLDNQVWLSESICSRPPMSACKLPSNKHLQQTISKHHRPTTSTCHLSTSICGSLPRSDSNSFLTNKCCSQSTGIYGCLLTSTCDRLLTSTYCSPSTSICGRLPTRTSVHTSTRAQGWPAF